MRCLILAIFLSSSTLILPMGVGAQFEMRRVSPTQLA
ncbi:MAG: hypothetical protein ACI82F_002158 [Planctomycetota bacterium]|jgi:hypothetical protein